MSRISNKVLIVAVSVGLAAFLASCGSAGSSNEQGTSFTAIGYCGDVECDTLETGRIVPLSTDIANINTGQFALDGQTIITFLQTDKSFDSTVY